MEGFYSVREMTRKLGVEAHMLRYWEKELKLDIPRDDKGRRIYGEEEARIMTMVSDYKKAGKPLKLIRTMITLPGREEEAGQKDGPTREDTQVRKDGPLWEENPVRKDGSLREEENGAEEEPGQAVIDFRKRWEQPVKAGQLTEAGSGETFPDSQRLQDLLSRMVAQAVQESTETMITEMKESILKELDYQFRLQAEREAELRREVLEAQEEHFQRMDVLLRNKNEGRKKKFWR
ncbi:MAG: MerR family transcriptional regulator [Lachnospiraceae bacterium]|nr:MerR family transcriptional regulator [Lachnospiraceae bacterium]